jgi:hypothetical protein
MYYCATNTLLFGTKTTTVMLGNSNSRLSSGQLGEHRFHEYTIARMMIMNTSVLALSIITRGRALRVSVSVVALTIAIGYLVSPKTRAVAAEKEHWLGVYVYEASAGQPRGGTGMVVDYTLTIKNSTETPSAILQLEGFQTDETIYCDTAAGPGSLEVRFKNYANGETANKYGVEVYKPGEVLLILKRLQTGVLITDWRALELPDLKPRKPGRYFKKVKDPQPNSAPPLHMSIIYPMYPELRPFSSFFWTGVAASSLVTLPS